MQVVPDAIGFDAPGATYPHTRTPRVFALSRRWYMNGWGTIQF
jgi:hypothetical protein